MVMVMVMVIDGGCWSWRWLWLFVMPWLLVIVIANVAIVGHGCWWWYGNQTGGSSNSRPQGQAKPVPDCLVGELARFVCQSGSKGIDKIVADFTGVHPEASKRQVEKKIQARYLFSWPLGVVFWGGRIRTGKISYLLPAVWAGRYCGWGKTYIGKIWLF